MKRKEIKIGAKVSVIDDTIKGIVISIKNKEVTIKDENEFLYQYEPLELVVIDDVDILNNIDVIKVKGKETQNKRRTTKTKNKITSFLEVDLHIHQITKSNKGMRNHAMLTKQLSVAKQKLNFAIENKIKKVVFIHGIGKGVLKEELYHLLKKYPVEINDASYKKYGQGAIEVKILKSFTV